MIEGLAPPTEHKTQHQDGGDDALDVTGLVGAGGDTLPFLDFLWTYYGEGLDGISDGSNAGGSVTVTDEYVELATNGTQYSLGLIKKNPFFVPLQFEWAKNRMFNTKVRFRLLGAKTNTKFVVATGDPDASSGWGFLVADGVFQTVCRNGTNQSTHVIEDFGSFGIEDRTLRAHRTNFNEVKFYVDNLLVHTETSYVPYGITDAKEIMHMWAYNSDTGDGCTLRFSTFDFWQAA